MADLTYLLDANVFIEAARRYYAFDLVPLFWDALTSHADEGVLASIDRVGNELLRGNDDLAEWAKSGFAHAFLSTDNEETIEAYREVMKWVQDQGQFLDAAKEEFAAGADGWLVACAIVKECTIVTHETLEPDVKKKVKIPNVCQAFSVRPVDTFEMLRALGVRFG